MSFVFAQSSLTSWGIGLHDTAHLVNELVKLERLDTLERAVGGLPVGDGLSHDQEALVGRAPLIERDDGRTLRAPAQGGQGVVGPTSNHGDAEAPTRRADEPEAAWGVAGAAAAAAAVVAAAGGAGGAVRRRSQARKSPTP